MPLLVLEHAHFWLSFLFRRVCVNKLRQPAFFSTFTTIRIQRRLHVAPFLGAYFFVYVIYRHTCSSVRVHVHMFSVDSSWVFFYDIRT